MSTVNITISLYIWASWSESSFLFLDFIGIIDYMYNKEKDWTDCTDVQFSVCPWQYGIFSCDSSDI